MLQVGLEDGPAHLEERLRRLLLHLFKVLALAKIKGKWYVAVDFFQKQVTIPGS
jgi:hypothetical protein